jgi:diguanylate cyclase (GGDEF)-like protein
MTSTETPAHTGWALGLVPEWDELLVSTLSLAASFMRARWCALFLLDQDLHRLVLARLWNGEQVAAPEGWEPHPGSPEWEVVERRSPAAALRAGGEWLGGNSGSSDIRPYPTASAPVETEGSMLGVVEVIRSASEPPFQESDLETLRQIGQHLALWLRNSAVLRRLRELAITDGLTELFNHRYFQDRLGMEMERAARYERPLALLMMDINRFKQYNDLHGHPQGDVALRVVAAAIEQAVRRIDVVARYGGDEFSVILPETGSLQAMAAASRIARAVREQQVPCLQANAPERLSVSIGISCYPDLAQCKKDLIAQADQALYRSKKSRGQRARMWEPDRDGELTV